MATSINEDINGTSPEKRARTQTLQPVQSGASIIDISMGDRECLDEEQVKIRTTSTQPHGRTVDIQLSSHIKPSPPSWSTAVPTQLTFHDLRWKPLETEEEKKSQWKKLDALTREFWEEKQREEEEERVERVRQHRESAAERQRRHRQRRREAQAVTERNSQRANNELSVNKVRQKNS
jgi:hypothetical protein